MFPTEIVLERTKPETEWVRGRALRKASPTYRHGLAQRLIATALGEWAVAGGYGRVATEWRFRISPAGERARPLVPDVAYLSYATLGSDARVEDVDVPRYPPTVAVEILSPDDRDDDVADKIAVYLAAGTSAVLIIDARNERAIVHDRDGARPFGARDTLSHTALPGFALELGSVFAAVRSAN